MDIIIVIVSIIISVLIGFLVFLVFKVIKYKIVCNRYELLERSQDLNEWQKYSPQQTHIPINRETDKYFNVNNTCNRLNGLIPSSISENSQKELESGQSGVKSSGWSRT